jgi:phosphoglycerate dehydrogenase-like enzyme
MVTCSRGAGSVPISEFVLAAMLAFEKRLPDVWATEAPEHWGWASLGGLHRRRLAVVGLGSIGSRVAQLGLAFGMEVRAVRRTEAPSPVAGVELVDDLDRLLGGADHIVVSAPATPRTQHLIGSAAFAAMKDGAHLVNIARGALVDQDALQVALDSGRVARATLDACDPEPLPAGHWLYDHPQVRLSPHISWSSPELTGRILELFIENLRARAEGRPLAGVVNPAEGY